MTAPIKWEEAISPIYWSSIGIDWDTPALAESPSFALDNTYVIAPQTVFPNSISFLNNLTYGQADQANYSDSISFDTDFDELMLAGFSFAGFANIGLSTNLTSSSQSDSVGAATFDSVLDTVKVGNRDFYDSISYALDGNLLASSAFLWSPLSDPSSSWGAETNPSTLWSSVSDPSSSWSSVSGPTSSWEEKKDPETNWTKSDYPN